MFEGLYFEYPKMATLVFVYIACEAYCKLRSSAIYFPHATALTKESTATSTVMWILKWLSTVFLVLAMMSPVHEEFLELAPTEGYNIAMILDASHSMQTKAFDSEQAEKSRFDVMKKTASDFIAKRSDDGVGLILFGDDAIVVAPLTYDRGILQQILSHQEAGAKSTALNKAVAQAANLMQSANIKNRIAILLTDGQNSANSEISLPVAMALIKKEKIRFYTIGIGSSDEYDADVLSLIANESGGKSFSATNAQELQSAYREIDSLEKSKIEHFDYVFKKYFYIYPLFLAFFTLLAYVYLRNRRGWL